MVIGGVVVVAAALMAIAEWIHSRRIRRVSFLAFDGHSGPRSWVLLVPAMRIAAVAGVVGGLLFLTRSDGNQIHQRSLASQSQSERHFVLALDVSPSMHLVDAGADGKQSRSARAGEVLRSLLDRIDRQHRRVSVIAFYSDAKPVVIDTVDDEVIDNILDDLPLEYAFDAGKTNMYTAIRATEKISARWRRGSATFVLIGDGDTLPDEKTAALSGAFRSSLVIGVGNPHRGTFIDDHSSRQDARSLKKLAARLHGRYFDANQVHVPSRFLQQLNASFPNQVNRKTEGRHLALAAIFVGACVLTFLPVALSLAGAPTKKHPLVPLNH